jgi:hypothetical protein
LMRKNGRHLIKKDFHGLSRAFLSLCWPTELAATEESSFIDAFAGNRKFCWGSATKERSFVDAFAKNRWFPWVSKCFLRMNKGDRRQRMDCESTCNRLSNSRGEKRKNRNKSPLHQRLW